jgi:hypothetical protein
MKTVLICLILLGASLSLTPFPIALDSEELEGLWWIQMFLNWKQPMQCFNVTFIPYGLNNVMIDFMYLDDGKYVPANEEWVANTDWTVFSEGTGNSTIHKYVLDYDVVNNQWVTFADAGYGGDKVWFATRNQTPPSNILIQAQLLFIGQQGVNISPSNIQYVNNTACMTNLLSK